MEILHIPKKIDSLDLPTDMKITAYLINKSAYRVPDKITLGAELIMLWQEKESTVGLTVNADRITVHTEVDKKEGTTMSYANTVLCEDYEKILRIDDQILPAMSGMLIPGTFYGSLDVHKTEDTKFKASDFTLKTPSVVDNTTLLDWFTFTGKL